MFHLLLYVTEIVKQSHAVRAGRFQIEFQPAQGNLTHTHGDRLSFVPCYFSPFFPVRGSGSPSPTTESDHSAPVRPDKKKPTSTKRVKGRSTRRSNQVLKLTDYHISRHVASTFKRLTKWTTHSYLNHFRLHQRGITTTQPPPVVLIFQQKLKSVNSYNLAKGRKPLDFYRT